MKEYETKQRKQLTYFFEENPDRQFTVEELVDAIKGVSVSTLYRNVNQMTQEGIVRRFQKNENRKFFYQYIGGGECDGHLHLKCNKCGRILHADDEGARAIAAAVKSSFNFEVDQSATMMFGSCVLCK